MPSPIAIDLPPGVVKTDSPLAATGRWVDTQWIRFWKNKPEKIGGYSVLSVLAMDSYVRALHVWNDLTSREWVGCGTINKLWAFSDQDYTPVDITPTGLAAGITDPGVGYGWGAGKWNDQTWNTPRDYSSIMIDPSFWSIDNFGKMMMAARSGGPIYLWDPTTLPVVAATALTGTVAPPIAVNGLFITAEQFLIAYGTDENDGNGQDPMRMHWCAQGDYTDWDVTKIAGALGSPSGTRKLRRGRRIMAGCDLGGFVSLIWTDTAVYLHQYTGAANVFNTSLAGTDCGLLGPNAFTIAGGVAYWASNNNFKMYASGVQDMPNSEEVSQWVYNQLRDFFGIKTIAFYNVNFNEIWFVFVTDVHTEPTLYCAYSLGSQKWFTGTFPNPRTAAARYDGADQRPIMASDDFYIYRHDDGLDASTPSGTAALPYWLTTGPVEIQSGASLYDVSAFMPDTQRIDGQTLLTFSAFDRIPEGVSDEGALYFAPTDGLVDFGNYRVSGRAVQFTLYGGDVGCDIRLGVPKIEYQPSGTRR